MRKRRTELNIIGMSALDVFASALGVFIIIASVALPFIFNKSQSSQSNLLRAQLEADMKFNPYTAQTVKNLINEIVSLKQELLTLQSSFEADSADPKYDNSLVETLSEKIAQLEQTLKETEEELNVLLQTPATTDLIPPIDLVIALDTTRSMTEELRSLQGGVIYLSRILLKYSESPAVGIFEIMDECDYRYRKKFALRKIGAASIAQLQDFVYSLGLANTDCNNDQPEAIHLALREALTSNWRADVQRRVVVLISDNPPYSRALPEVRLGIERFSNVNSQTVSIVHPVSSYTAAQDIIIMKDLARIGKGEYIDGAGSIIGAIILAL